MAVPQDILPTHSDKPVNLDEETARGKVALGEAGSRTARLVRVSERIHSQVKRLEDNVHAAEDLTHQAEALLAEQKVARAEREAMRAEREAGRPEMASRPPQTQPA